MKTCCFCAETIKTMVAVAVLTGAFLVGSHVSSTAQSQSATDTPVSTVIAGVPSTGRHCVSGNAANVHALGWVESGSIIAVTFDADFTPTAALARLDLDSEAAAASYGNPDLLFSASSSGTVALYVTGNGQSGCYRYKVEVQAPATISPVHDLQRVLNVRARTRATTRKPSTATGHATAIAGLSSSASHCVSGDYVSNVHGIGRVDQGAEVTVTFDSDFDPIAGITNVDLEAQSATYLIDDDGGGNLEPLLSFTASHAGTLALFVAGVNGRAGCYQYKVEITAPTGSTTGVSLTGVVTESGAGTFVRGATITIFGRR